MELIKESGASGEEMNGRKNGERRKYGEESSASARTTTPVIIARPETILDK